MMRAELPVPEKWRRRNCICFPVILVFLEDAVKKDVFDVVEDLNGSEIERLEMGVCEGVLAASRKRTSATSCWISGRSWPC